jgi:hypothetical protein
VAVARFDGGAQEGIVQGEGGLHGVAVALPEGGGAGDVGEEEGDGAGGEGAHGI